MSTMRTCASMSLFCYKRCSLCRTPRSPSCTSMHSRWAPQMAPLGHLMPIMNACRAIVCTDPTILPINVRFIQHFSLSEAHSRINRTKCTLCQCLHPALNLWGLVLSKEFPCQSLNDGSSYAGATQYFVLTLHAAPGECIGTGRLSGGLSCGCLKSELMLLTQHAMLSRKPVPHTKHPLSIDQSETHTFCFLQCHDEF